MTEAIEAGRDLAAWLADPVSDETTYRLQRAGNWLSGCGSTARRIARDAALEALADAG